MRHPNWVCVSLLAIMLTCSDAEEQPKRAPSGFTGVRGKKSISAEDAAVEEAAHMDDNPNEMEESRTNIVSSFGNLLSEDGDVGVEKRASPAGFMGMRGKKPYYYYTQPWNGIYQPDGLKRAPSGFFGMRGKRDWETLDYDTYPKRGPSGFFGMRGKKGDYEEKRAPMGFVGMRGKKMYDEEVDELEKRAPAGFFGVRGKKQPGKSGFFGMRGKKYPYEFRGKFVGVRGKKMYNDDAPVDDTLDINQLMLLLTEQNRGDDLWYYDRNDIQQ